jgi:hypothetical protein
MAHLHTLQYAIVSELFLRKTAYELEHFTSEFEKPLLNMLAATTQIDLFWYKAISYH